MGVHNTQACDILSMLCTLENRTQLVCYTMYTVYAVLAVLYNYVVQLVHSWNTWGEPELIVL